MSALEKFLKSWLSTRQSAESFVGKEHADIDLRLMPVVNSVCQAPSELSLLIRRVMIVGIFC
jgi:hypothetical protein